MRFVRNPLFESQVKASPGYRKMTNLAARTVAENARVNAPVRSGDYSRSIHVAGDIVYTDDPFGHLIEWGSINNPAYAPLRKGTRAAGLQLKPRAK